MNGDHFGSPHSGHSGENSVENGCQQIGQLRRPRIKFAELPDLSTKYKPTELIEILDSRGFVSLLDSKSNINEKAIINILKIITKALEAKDSGRINPFLSAIGSKSVFFRMHLKEYLEQIEEQVVNNHDNQQQLSLLKEIEEKIESITDILTLIKQLLVKFPHETNMYSRQLLTLIKMIRQIHHNVKLSDSVQKILSEVEEEVDIAKKIIENANAANVVKPPNDFRKISVVPVLSDIKEDTQDIFLRKNLVEGKYESVDHYLDVQFRLMREDFLRPLREGIKQYLNALETKQRIYRLNDAFIYYNVRIMEMEFSEFGLEIRMQLDMSTLPRIKWKTTKRLMSGSLICFSWNRFEDFIIATVSGQRNEELLERGFFSAVIDTSHETKIMNVINEDPDKNFVIIEPLSYFEAYKHILLSLQTFNESNFPLNKYIVNVNRKIDSPSYINDLTTYDFKSFLSSFMQNKICDKNEDDLNDKTDEKSEPQSNALVSRLSEVNILNNSSWPTAEEFRMDESQLNALKDALTRELSIIQGPPGTGKTFIGLRIVEALMNNRQHWDADGSGTILVACYTNHALDQFLEGILPLCNKILRIGGRCRNENLKKYCLKEMKIMFRRSVPLYIVSRIVECRRKLNKMKAVVNTFFKKISALRKSLLPPKVLDVIKTEISEHQANSLKSLVKNKHLCEDFNFSDALKVWLEENANETAKSEESYEDAEEDEEEIQRLQDERESEDAVEEDWINEYDAQDDDNEMEEPDTFLVDASKIDDKTFKQYFDKQMSNDETMDIEIARKISDVKSLPHKKRWSLYRLWVKLYIRTLMKAEDNIFDTKVGARLRERMQELKIEEELKISKDAKIIGVTTTGAAKNRALIAKLKPKIVIVEEAAEILESHIITSMTAETKHLILIGDHIQLKPNPTVYELAKNYSLDVSLFERLIKNQLSFSKLKIQHRMHPSISEYLVPLFYPELENDESVTKYESIKGITKNIFFFNHNEYEEAPQNDGRSRYNLFEIDFVFRLCQYLILQGYKSEQITVLTMYSAQMFRMRFKFRDYFETKSIRISVVDNFQGEENDIIVCSFVRSNAQRDIGFLKTPNRINVSMSRAKKGFYAVGNFEMFARVSGDLWDPLVQRLKNRGCFGNELELYCQNHVDQKILVSQPDGFSKFADGGCMKQCDYRLHCGHLCPRTCHSYDIAHEHVRCNDKCLTICCENNHRCQKRCHPGEKCGPCFEKIPKNRSCGHVLVTQCARDVEKDICNLPCEKKLRCGHQCNKRCIDDCSTAVCDKMVKAKSYCGHAEVEARCGEKHDTSALLKQCEADCNEILKCGHKCDGTCGTCKQGRLHMKCVDKCGRPLICGHICKSPCGNNCPPCKRECENICTHDAKCRHKCGTLCTPCRKLCNFSCEHCWCVNLCSEQCEQKFKKCSKKLNCNHKCRGINGYTCLTVCDTCEPEKFKGVKYSKDDNDTCFIQLKNCGHLFEANGLYKHLLLKNGTDAKEDGTEEDHQLKCPDCGSMIEDSLFDMIKSVNKTNKRLIHGCSKNNARCGHPCIGICGEKCPELCRICDKSEVEKIFFGTEDDKNARFVQLRPCNHIFEYSGFQKWISQAVASRSNSEESVSIQMICCPNCKQPLNQSMVFNSEICQIIDDIENIKKRFNGVIEDNSVRRNHLIEKYGQLTEREKLEVKRGKKVYSGVMRTLLRCRKDLDKRSLTNSELEMVSNALKIVDEVIDLSVKEDIFDKTYNARLNEVVDFLNNHCASSNNEQQMSDIMFEINVLKNYRNIFSLKGNLKNEVNELVTQAKELFHSVGRLSETQAEKLKKIVNQAIELNGGIPKKEMKMVLKAMNFGQKGHWFKCPNGHPYCITECGGAIETGKCPECQEEIGGTSHRLLETNTIATDIDQAIMSAYDYNATVAV